MTRGADIKWGVVSTVKAPLEKILDFAAYHLEHGAHRLYLYLDDPDPLTAQTLKAHPKIRATPTNDSYWSKKGKRPEKHQPRQTINAADAYAKRAEVDWLCHIDVDEFLDVDCPLEDQLAALPDDCLCARIRPIEALDISPHANGLQPFKSFPLPMPERRRMAEELYPEFGAYLNGGFLSHVAGKMIYRTGIEGLSVKIHNAFLGEMKNPGQVELTQTRLCHLHAHNWDDWIAQYRYRLEKGAYRDELQAPFDKGKGGLNMHGLLTAIEAQDGENGLCRFYTEVCTARPELLLGLKERDLLYWRDLDLENLRKTHFQQ